MRALVFKRKPVRYAAAMVAGAFAPGRGAKVGPLSLDIVDEPALPGDGWHRLKPSLSGICGSDLATIDGTSSRYFEPVVSFPFVPGHEVVGVLDDGRRVVVEPVLKCATRGIHPPCDRCAAGDTNLCERIAFGHLEPGLQTGFCTDTGGGWSGGMIVHDSQLHVVPDDLSDEAAVMVEPTACAVHAAAFVAGDRVAIIGSGTLGLLTLAAIAARRDGASPPRPTEMLVTAKYPEQKRWATTLGATTVVGPDQLERAVRASTRSLRNGDQLTGGVDTVVDCVGSDASIAQALRVVAPGGTIVLVGMPARVSLDLTGLWHREVAIRGAYAYTAADFGAAFELVRARDLGRLVTETYPLDRYTDAIAHAAEAGPRGAVKIAFDLRQERR